MSAVRITIVSSSLRARCHVYYLKTKLRAAHKLLNSPTRELSIAIVGDKQMSGLHEKFMNIAGPTDVLTFPLEFDARNRCISGEIVVCAPHAFRQARKLKIEFKHELLLYTLHGLLHLSGFDDKNQRHYQRMHRKEDSILRQLGAGPIFSKGQR
jgi:probable rRNA maturation factor